MVAIGHQNIPELFKVIVEVDTFLEEMRKAPVVPFRESVELLKRRKDLSRAAELALKWNTDKGKHV